jgi:hypothetical protein
MRRWKFCRVSRWKSRFVCSCGRCCLSASDNCRVWLPCNWHVWLPWNWSLVV